MTTRFRALLEATPDAIVIIDRTGAITFVNAQAEQMFGYQSGELIGVSIDVLVPERLRHRHGEHRGNYFDAPHARPMAASQELNARRKSGEEFPVEISLSPIDTQEGLQVISAIRDVTDRRAAQRAAEQANRIKDEFLATLSHELRTPLNAILGWATMLAGGSLDEAATLRAVHSIIRSARQQGQLIEDLLDVSRIVTGSLRLNVQSVLLAPVIEAAIDTIRPAAAARSIRLDVVLDRTVLVSGDSARLQQIAWNLLSNAVKFTPRDGHILVTLEQKNDSACFVVKDAGCGIDPAFLPYVFDRFRQADSGPTRSLGGLGLGLAIVRHLVDLHGGSVRAESGGENLGATFTISIPVSVQKADRRVSAATARSAVSSTELDPADRPDLSGLRVLVVDDDSETRELLKTIVTAAGAEVRAAASAAEGLTSVTDHRPDIIICDIGMPGEDGYSFIRTIRSRGAGEGGRIPAIALTAYARAEDRKRSLRAGFQSHLAKPAEPMELLAVVASLVGRTNHSVGS